MKKLCALVLTILLPFQAVVASAVGHCYDLSGKAVDTQLQVHQAAEMNRGLGSHDHQQLHQKIPVETENGSVDYDGKQAQDSHSCGTCHSGCASIAVLMSQESTVSSVESVEPADINRLQALSPPLDQPERPQWASRA